MSDHRIPIRRALVSVYDKTGLEELVRALHEAGVELVSTGGSASLIEGLGVPVTKVEDLTGFPERLDGRVKTLHPKVHAGILADRRIPAHVAQRQRLGAEAFVHTATYDVHVASWMGNVLTDTSDGASYPAWVGATWDREA